MRQDLPIQCESFASPQTLHRHPQAEWQAARISALTLIEATNLLSMAGLQALAAIDARNPQALLEAGGAIDAACEACHVTYWYPNQRLQGT